MTLTRYQRYKNKKNDGNKRIRDMLLGRSGSAIMKRTNHLLAFEYLGGRCVDCGFFEGEPSLYDFHHRNQTDKHYQITQKLSKFGFDRLKAELDKCDLLCVNCHRTRHSVRPLTGIPYSVNKNSERVRRLSRENKRKSVSYKGGCCGVCGFSDMERIECFDFHHTDPTAKEIRMSDGFGHRRFAGLLPELDKCLLLCANCHRRIHNEINKNLIDSKIRLYSKLYIVENGEVIVVTSNDILLDRNRWMDVDCKNIVVRNAKMVKYTANGERKE